MCTAITMCRLVPYHNVQGISLPVVAKSYFPIQSSSNWNFTLMWLLERKELRPWDQHPRLQCLPPLARKKQTPLAPCMQVAPSHTASYLRGHGHGQCPSQFPHLIALRTSWDSLSSDNCLLHARYQPKVALINWTQLSLIKWKTLKALQSRCKCRLMQIAKWMPRFVAVEHFKPFVQGTPYSAATRLSNPKFRSSAIS